MFPFLLAFFSLPRIIITGFSVLFHVIYPQFPACKSCNKGYGIFLRRLFSNPDYFIQVYFHWFSFWHHLQSMYFGWTFDLNPFSVGLIFHTVLRSKLESAWMVKLPYKHSKKVHIKAYLLHSTEKGNIRWTSILSSSFPARWKQKHSRSSVCKMFRFVNGFGRKMSSVEHWTRVNPKKEYRP